MHLVLADTILGMFIDSDWSIPVLVNAETLMVPVLHKNVIFTFFGAC